ncbi:hypothetical protein NL676_031738 [Syzygium grande]|nr:hypothetical protein NL676_031738 [Syzygium grande]
MYDQIDMEEERAAIRCSSAYAAYRALVNPPSFFVATCKGFLPPESSSSSDHPFPQTAQLPRSLQLSLSTEQIRGFELDILSDNIVGCICNKIEFWLCFLADVAKKWPQ